MPVRLFFIFLLGGCGLSGAGADELSRRFFDFTAISDDNPVVATIDGSIKIPLSELRAYQQAERLQAITDPARLAEKRVVLNELIDEYLLVDEAYRTGVPQSPEFSRQMEATRTMVLTDFMAMRAISEKGPASAGEATGVDPAAAMAERLFEAARIDISNEAYELVKRAARAIDTTSAASQRGPVKESQQDASAKLRAIIDATPDAVLVRYENKTIGVRQILAIYAGLPVPRPAVATEAGLLELIKPLILPELMALEAVKQGIAADAEFQHKLIQNRTALLRFHMQDVISAKANELLRTPDLESKLRAWYDQHKLEYAPPEENRDAKIPSYQSVRERVLGDYSVAVVERLKAEKVAALRKVRAIAIDEKVLGAL